MIDRLLPAVDGGCIGEIFRFRLQGICFAKSSTPAFVLGISPTEEERTRQRRRDFAVVLARLVVYRNETLYARKVFVIEKRCRKDGAISRQ